MNEKRPAHLCFSTEADVFHPLRIPHAPLSTPFLKVIRLGFWFVGVGGGLYEKGHRKAGTVWVGEGPFGGQHASVCPRTTHP